MQTVLVAGGAGFIGSQLSRSLLKNYKVICVDNLITGSSNNIKDLLPNPNFTFIEEDVVKSLNIEDKIDFIFHLASPASPNKNNDKSYIALPLETLMANSQGTHNLLDLALKNNSRFLFASTSEVYGDPAISPQPETYFGNVNPNGVRSVYDEGKRFGEAITMAYFRKYKLDIRIVRIFNTYGPFMQEDDGRVVSNFITQAIENKTITVYGDGSHTRSFCYIDDMIDGLNKLMFTDGISGEVVNIGNPNERSIMELALLIKDLSGSNSDIKTMEDNPEDDPKTRKPDIKKAKELLSWQPQVTIEEGLKKTITYFKTLK